MKLLRRLFTPACMLAALLCAATVANAEKLTLMAGGTSKIVYLPLVLASQLGYFKDEGLEFEILSQPAGVDTATELLAGAIQGAVGFYDHTIDLQSRGKEVEALVVFNKSAGLVELVSRKSASGLRTMADAKGATLGVTGLGSSTFFLTRYLAARWRTWRRIARKTSRQSCLPISTVAIKRSISVRSRPQFRPSQSPGECPMARLLPC